MVFWLVMTSADGTERPFPINKERTVIGRALRSDVRIPVPSVEQRHCEIILREDALSLLDLGSATGTLHNGRRVSEAPLVHRDRLQIGPVTLEVRFDGIEAARGNAPVITTVKPREGAQQRD